VSGMPEPSFELLSRLWLHEPDARALETVRGIESLAPHIGTSAELSMAYTELLLLNVYPYGTVFTDPSGELNAPSGWRTPRRYEASGYSPPELFEVGAPDHAGLCLGFLGHLAARGESDPEFSSLLLDWLPVCCIAVEREPSAHPFYKSAAALTRAMLLQEAAVRADPPPEPPEDTDPEGEVGLSHIVRYLLAPARSGLFLSRSRIGWIARRAGMRIPFGSRWEVAETLFSAAGESGCVPEVLKLLREETDAWEGAYRKLFAQHPHWAPFARRWLERIAKTQRKLAGMREMLSHPIELEPVDDAPLR
jgi:TorA maturation chaperone TorD